MGDGQFAGDGAPGRQGLLGATLALGWRVLDDVPGRELVVGAVTRPWQANVTFRGIAPEAVRRLSTNPTT